MRNTPMRLLLWIGFWLMCSCVAQAEEDGKSESRGSLIIVGGGDTPTLVQERLVELAGGPGKARIAVLPMAGTKFDEEAREIIDELKQLKAEAVLLNIGREDAKKEATAKRLEEFTGYWFLGGDQLRLAAGKQFPGQRRCHPASMAQARRAGLFARWQQRGWQFLGWGIGTHV